MSQTLRQSSAVPDTAYDATMDEEDWAAVIEAAKSSERPDEDSDAADIAQSPMSDDQQGERRTVVSPESSTGEGGAAPLHPHIAVHGMESVPNLRDVATTSPSHVAAGVLFRSGTPANATPRDVEHLVHTLGIRTIVDLRSTEESAGDIGDRLAYHHFVDVEGHAKIVNRTKRELGDVFDRTRSSSTSRSSSLSLQRSGSSPRVAAAAAAKGTAKHRTLKVDRDYWESIADPAVLRAEIYRLQYELANGGGDGTRADSSEVAVSPHATDLNGFLIMLRPMSAKWKPTWCVLRGRDVEFYGTEKERVREVRKTAQDTHVTRKVGSKAVFAGKISLVSGVTCEWVNEGDIIEYGLILCSPCAFDHPASYINCAFSASPPQTFRVGPSSGRKRRDSVWHL
eukprot:m.252364 g.252364  ORF g.252364 m.252364 type:complete len:397 (-) comp26514_c2_seq5:1071-2261(-)